MVHGKKRIPYWIDWRLPGLAGPEYHAVISFGLPIEPEDSQYGEYRFNAETHPAMPHAKKPDSSQADGRSVGSLPLSPTFSRLVVVGAIVLIGVLVIFSEMNVTAHSSTAQPTEDEGPRTAGLPNARAQAATAPDPPRNLTVTVLGQTAVSADWEAPANDGGSPTTSYDLSYGPVGESPTIVSVSDLYKIVTGLRRGTRYEFRVSARNSAGSSSWIGAFATTNEPDEGVTVRHHDTDISISGLSSMITQGMSARSATESLIDTFRSGLRSNLRYTEFGDPMSIKNSTGLPIFYLLFASKHPRGLDFWEKSSKKLRSGQRVML